VYSSSNSIKHLKLMNTKKISQFVDALCTNTSTICRHDHGRAARTSATFPHTFTAGLSPTDCLTASRQRSEESYSLCHKGAALASRLLTNDPTKRQQLYSPSRKCTPAYCIHVESFNCILTRFRTFTEIRGLIPRGNGNDSFLHRVHARCGEPLLLFQRGTALWGGLLTPPSAKKHMQSRWGGFRLRNVITVGFTFYYPFICYIFWSYDHLQVEEYLSKITLLTTDPLLLGDLITLIS
jgi:hypothetical protein